MGRVLRVSTLGMLLLLLMAPVAFADWDPGDTYKMHFPQMPDEMGWDVYGTWPFILAEDWMCSETGQVKEIHFWGSWMHGWEGQIHQFNLKVFSDIPADPPQVPYSRPGDLLWQVEIPIWEVIIREMPPFPQGWYNPSNGEVFPEDHVTWYQYNIFLPEQLWFWQEQETIYWLCISAVVEVPQETQWGWKSTGDHWNDDAVWGIDDPPYGWIDIWEPFSGESLDLAFVIAGGDDDCCIPPMRGNIDMDPLDQIDISDLVYLVDYMFTGGPAPPCWPEANVDCSDDGNGVEGPEDIDISDLVYLVDYMFNQGPTPCRCDCADCR